MTSTKATRTVETKLNAAIEAVLRWSKLTFTLEYEPIAMLRKAYEEAARQPKSQPQSATQDRKFETGDSITVGYGFAGGRSLGVLHVVSYTLINGRWYYNLEEYGIAYWPEWALSAYTPSGVRQRLHTWLKKVTKRA